MSLLMIALSGSVDVFGGWYGFSTVGNGAILANGCGIQGQNYFAFLQGSEVIAVFHCKD